MLRYGNAPRPFRQFFSPLPGWPSAGTYSVAVIPAPVGLTSVYMLGINDSGQVAGYGLGIYYNQAFIASPSGATLVPLPTGLGGASFGEALNASGQVAGWLTGGAVFIGTPSGSILIPPPSG